MGELGLFFVASALAGNILAEKLVVPGAVLGFTRDPRAAKHHVLAYGLALLTSLWICWAAAPWLSFLKGFRWIPILGIASLVAWSGSRVTMHWVHGSPELVGQFRLLPANCGYVGGLLLMLNAEAGFLAVTGNGLGLAAGYGLMITLVASFRRKLALAPIPKSFVGLPSILILLGLISMVLRGLVQAFHLFPLRGP